jgi:hypothetical protein
MCRVWPSPKENFSPSGFVLRARPRLGCFFVFLIASGLLCSPSAVAADAPAWTPVPSRPAEFTARDLELMLRATRLLLEDEDLAKLPLGVSVRDRVATLWGTVPTKEIAQRAEDRLKQLLGLAAVRSQLHIDGDAGPAAQAPRVGVFERPPLSEPVVPRPVPRVQRSLVHRPSEHGPVLGQEMLWHPAERHPAAPIMQFTPAPVGLLPGADKEFAGNDARRFSPRAATLGDMPSLSLMSPSASAPALEAPPAGLAEAIETLRLQDDRFRRIKPELRGQVVHLRGTVARWDHLYDLARMVARLRGVERVVLEDIHTNP